MNKICSIEDIHKVQLDLLKELKRVCDKNSITYYLACGTCLGAVRHKGFIPWDHDVDVFMYISDISKLESCMNQFRDNYFLQCKKTDPNWFATSYRMVKSDTTYITKDSIGVDCNQGIAMDIYPLYYYPKNFFKAHCNILRSHVYGILSGGRVPRNHGILVKFGAKCLLALYKGKKRTDKAERLKRKLCETPKGEYILTYFGLDISFVKALLYKTEWFEEPTDMLFEGEIFSGPTNYEAYLRKKYGNYMSLPPEEERPMAMEDIIIADVTKGYKEYKDVYLPK